ncbi:hypothetical protein ACQ4PT_019470 [Festuca glaucescens]
MEEAGAGEVVGAQEPAAGGTQAPPRVADPDVAALTEDGAAPGADDVPLPAAVEVVPAAAPAAASWLKDRLVVGLLMLILAILVSLFVYDMGTDPTAWWGKLATMTPAQWFTAGFLTLGIITSLGLIFSPSRNFLRVWTEGAAGLAVVVPPLAGIINCGVWLAYGLLVKDHNVPVVVVNGTGVAFNIVYTAVFFLRSGTPRLRTLCVMLVAAAVAAMIGTIDYSIIKTWGWEPENVVGPSGALTGSFMYTAGAFVSMMAAHQNRGVGGFSGQAVASSTNAFVWLVYAWVQNNTNMKISNGLGFFWFLVMAAQLVFLHFKEPHQEETQDIHRRLLAQEP